MNHSNFKLALTSVALSAALAGCGWGIFDWGGGGGGNNDRVTVVGTIRDVSPETTRDIVVFVFNVSGNNNNGNGQLCPCPELPCNLNSGEGVVVEDGEVSFELNRLANGSLRVVFLLDNPGNEADATIDDGDMVAILDDEGCDLSNVRNRSIVTLDDLDIEFAPIDIDDDRCGNGNGNDDTTTTTEDDSCDVVDPPAPGRARADSIEIDLDNDDNDDNDNVN
ncbi:MAG TPA: hypothetical protein VEB21_10440 [Terriglobales bacterium]|nr:hypothetical protein [Terriglobales bacterium]